MIRRHILRGRQRGRARSGSVRIELERLEERTLLSSLSIAAENRLPGVPASVWDISGAGDPTLQGFATDISVNQGQTVSLKIDDTSRAPYHIDIYRMGYYQGDGARLVTTIPSSQALRQVQPVPLTDPTTGLVDCGNWSVSASWAVPADATSGIYFARLTRDDTGGASHIVFVIRDDTDYSQILFKTSDSTWEAYNSYGGNDIENPDHANRAYEASYNRPFNTRATTGGEGDQNWVFNAEYPMVRWLEANSYDVSYFTDVDTNRYGGLIENHQIFLSVGHDEYWSGDERANVEAARDAGVNLAFFSGNECFRKTRWEPSIDGSGTAYRTMVIYNESYDNARIDPLDTAPTWTWTGTWRDTRFSPPSDGGRPENALSGTLYVANNAGNDCRHQHGGARGRCELAVLAEHEHRDPGARPGRDVGRPRCRLRGRRRPGQRVPSRRPDRHVVDHVTKAQAWRWCRGARNGGRVPRPIRSLSIAPPAARWCSVPGRFSGPGAWTGTTTRENPYPMSTCSKRR